eukprot:jgi/Bigna1/67597/fgenesh1_pg.4_\
MITTPYEGGNGINQNGYPLFSRRSMPSGIILVGDYKTASRDASRFLLPCPEDEETVGGGGKAGAAAALEQEQQYTAKKGGDLKLTSGVQRRGRQGVPPLPPRHGAVVRLTLRDLPRRKLECMKRVLETGPFSYELWGGRGADNPAKESRRDIDGNFVSSIGVCAPCFTPQKLAYNLGDARRRAEVGIRRFRSTPIFSKGKREPYRFVRSFDVNERLQASYYGRVAYLPSPVLAFLPSSRIDPASQGRGEVEGMGNLTGNAVAAAAARPPPLLPPFDRTLGPLVATGWVEAVDPFRVMLRHRILNGKIFKVHKYNSATMRDLVYCKEDGEFLKDVKLWTHTGLEGRIQRCIGTHGNLKCTFTGKPTLGEAAFMTLYKRQFPPLNLVLSLLVLCVYVSATTLLDDCVPPISTKGIA